MKEYRIYEYTSGRLVKPLKSKNYRHDYATFEEANKGANAFAEKVKGQTLIVDYTIAGASKIISIIEWFDESKSA